MKKLWKRILSTTLCLIFFTLLLDTPTTSHALYIAPINVQWYTLRNAFVYAAPDLNSKVIITIDRFLPVRVTGITDNGFFRVDLNGTYYIPQAMITDKLTPDKTAKQLALEKVDKIAEAYIALLDQMSSYSSTFALLDINGDHIPEVFDASGKEIYTFHGEHAVMVYYNEQPVQFYYDKKSNTLAGKYIFNKKEYWERYAFDYSLFTWGQVFCYSWDVSDVKKDLQPVARNYTNDANTKGSLKSILQKIING